MGDAAVRPWLVEKAMPAKIRKAVVTGVTAGASAAVAVLAKSGWHLDHTTVSQALGAFVTAAAVADWTDLARPERGGASALAAEVMPGRAS